MNSPLSKSNTVHQILEEVIEQYGRVLEERKIKIFKKFEPDLPETMIQDEPLKYVFTSLIQYMLPVIPPQGSIGFLTKSVVPPKASNEEETPPSREREYIEILMIFPGFKQAVDSAKRVFGISTPLKEEAFDLELRLVYEILKKHQGTLRFEVNEKKPRTLISLRLPIERRKVLYYPPAIHQGERSVL
jgi:nitrogen-specific signal transduction histidine kinase